MGLRGGTGKSEEGMWTPLCGLKGRKETLTPTHTPGLEMYVEWGGGRDKAGGAKLVPNEEISTFQPPATGGK